MSTQSFTPAEISELDQSLAQVSTQLDHLVSHYRRISAGEGESRALSTVSLALLVSEANPGLGVSTLDILLAAVVRLARQPETTGDAL